MRIVARIVVAAALAGLAGAGCAGGETEPDPGAADRVAVETAASDAELRGAQAVREVVAIRTAGAEAGVVSTQIFAAIAAAGQQPRAQGARTLRRELPPLLAAAATVWPRSYRGDRGPGAEAARRHGGNGRSCSERCGASSSRSPACGASSAQSGDAWPPVLRFGARSDDLRRVLAGEIDAMMAAIPPNESEALRRAFAGG